MVSKFRLLRLMDKHTEVELIAVKTPGDIRLKLCIKVRVVPQNIAIVNPVTEDGGHPVSA